MNPRPPPSMTGAAVLRRFETMARKMVVPEGDHVGRPIKLLPFQKRFVAQALAPSVKRAYLSTARKTGKTTLIAMVLAFLILDRGFAVRNSEIALGSMSVAQARRILVLLEALMRSPRMLRDGEPVMGFRRFPNAEAWTLDGTNQTVRLLARKAATAMGGSYRAVILDEIGEIDAMQDDFVDALARSTYAYEGSRLLAISTQSAYSNTLWSNMLDTALHTPAPDVYVQLHRAPEGCRLDDEAAWKAACPSLGLHTSLAQYRHQVMEAMGKPSEVATFRRYMLNQRVVVWPQIVDVDLWRKATAPGDPPPGWDRVTGGLDLSTGGTTISGDMTSWCLAFHYPDGRIFVRSASWLPGEDIARRAKDDGVPYDLWAAEGWLDLCEGRTIDFGQVADRVAADLREYEVHMVGYDRFRFRAFARDLEAAGIDIDDPLWRDYRQGGISYEPAINLVERGLAQGSFTHEGNPTLNAAVTFARTRCDQNGNRAPHKQESKLRIDAACAMLMAVGVEAVTEEKVRKGGFVYANPWSDPSFKMSGDDDGDLGLVET